MNLHASIEILSQKRKMTSFESLPEELLIEQLLILPPEDVLNACQTSRQFAQVCRRSHLWIRLIKRDLPLVRVDQDPRKIYQAALRIRERFPEVSWLDLADPVALYNYSLKNGNFIQRVWDLFNLPWRIEMITNNLGILGWDTVNGLIPHFNLDFGNPPIDFPNIFLEPVIGEVLLNMFQRQHPEIYHAVIEMVLKERNRRETRKFREETLAEPLSQGQYVFEYRLPDGTLHGIDLTKFYLQGNNSRRFLADGVIDEMDLLKDQLAEPLHEDSLGEMSGEQIHYAAQNGEYRLRYLHPDGRVHSIEVFQFYKPWIKDRAELEKDLLELKSRRFSETPHSQTSL